MKTTKIPIGVRVALAVMSYYCVKYLINFIIRPIADSIGMDASTHLDEILSMLISLSDVIAWGTAISVVWPLLTDLGWIRDLTSHDTKESTSPLSIELAQAIQRVKEEPEKVKPAWDLARVRLELYFDRNLSQINYIFWLSVVVMIVGFGFILFGISQAFVTAGQTKATIEPNTATPAIVGGIAGIITEFIGATFLFLYRSTIQQAASYTKTLERINSVGMAMQILDTISVDSKELQDKTKSDIVKMLLRQNQNLPESSEPNKTN